MFANATKAAFKHCCKFMNIMIRMSVNSTNYKFISLSLDISIQIFSILLQFEVDILRLSITVHE